MLQLSDEYILDNAWATKEGNTIMYIVLYT